MAFTKEQNNYVLLAENAIVNNNYIEAIECYHKCLAIGYKEDIKMSLEDEKSISRDLAYLYSSIGMTKEALEMYDELISLDPKDADIYYEKYDLLKDIGDYEQALECCLAAIKVDDELDRSYAYLAEIYDVIGQFDKAIKYYKESLGIKEDANIYNNIGSLYETTGDYEKAFYYVSKSLELDKDNSRSNFNMGVIQRKLNNEKEALRYYNKAIILEPSYLYSYLNISAMYIENGEYRKSIDVLSAGILNNSWAADLYYNRSCCYAKIDKEVLALRDMEKALKLDKELVVWYEKDEDFKFLREKEEFSLLLERYKE